MEDLLISSGLICVMIFGLSKMLKVKHGNSKCKAIREPL